MRERPPFTLYYQGKTKSKRSEKMHDQEKFETCKFCEMFDDWGKSNEKTNFFPQQGSPFVHGKYDQNCFECRG